MSAQDTVAAVITAPGAAGVGIVRVSGTSARRIAEAVLGRCPRARYAAFLPFRDADGSVIDSGIALFFRAPHSFTGEDVLELQAHGGPVVLDLLLRRVLGLGARIARPGEFTERAFLNGKLDLAQAEAIADLVESASEASARLAARTLQGDFSRRIDELLDHLSGLRAYVEAAVDFPDEEIDILSGEALSSGLDQVREVLARVEAGARQGQLLRDGMTLVIAGRPNAGKSSLMNALAGRDAAIVTHIPGTTRDVLRERIQIDGLPIHLVDTAGIREAADLVELEGIRRAREQIASADRILWVFEDGEDPDPEPFSSSAPLTLVRNKIDLTGTEPGIRTGGGRPEVAVSAASGRGMDALRLHLQQSVGYLGPNEGEFMARRRHLDALSRTRRHLQAARGILETGTGAELLAEELRLAQNALSEITGAFLPDDLYDQIFSRFCIGK